MNDSSIQTQVYNVPSPTTPLPGDVGEEVRIWIMQNSMHHLLGMPISQIPTVSAPGFKTQPFTLLYMHMVSGHIPHV